jgi:hypothetical protein
MENIEIIIKNIYLGKLESGIRLIIRGYNPWIRCIGRRENIWRSINKLGVIKPNQN